MKVGDKIEWFGDGTPITHDGEVLCIGEKTVYVRLDHNGQEHAIEKQYIRPVKTEPPCPVVRTEDEIPCWHRRKGRKMFYDRVGAIAICFQHAIEKGWVKVRQSKQGSWYTVEITGTDCFTAEEVVEAIWPSVFESKGN